MKRKHTVNLRTYIRAVVTWILLIGWSFAALTGFLLWFAPGGPRAGKVPLFLGLTRHEWGDLHFLISLMALYVTVVHIILDWRALLKLSRYLLHVHQHPDLLE